MANKSELQSFNKDWSKLRIWAADKGVNKSSLIPVYDMAATRFKRGEPMSVAEEYRAILAASGKGSTVLPTTTRHPSQVLDNTRDTLWNIFTGLNPVGIAKNLWDTVSNTIKHPDTLLKEITGTRTALKKFIEHPTASILELLPGGIDTAKVMAEGWKKGFTTLADHPVSSLLDTMLTGSIAGFGLRMAGMDVSDILASRLASQGIDVEEVQSQLGDSFWRTLGKLAKTAPNKFSKGITVGYDEAGDALISQDTIGDTIRKWQTRFGVGKEPGKLMGGVLSKRESVTAEAMQVLKPVNDILKNFTPAKLKVVKELLETSGKDYSEILNDDTLPIDVRSAIEAWEPDEKWMQERALSSGGVEQVRMPDGSSELYSKATAKPLQSRIDRVNAAEQAFYERGQEAAGLTTRAGQIDQLSDGIFKHLSTLKTSIWTYITKTIPKTADDLKDQLASSVTPNADLDSTIGAGKIMARKSIRTSPGEAQAAEKLGLPVENSRSGRMYTETVPLQKSHINVIGDVFKPGGLIDQMQGALTDKNWVGFRDLSKQASRHMDGLFAHELHIEAAPDVFNAVRQQLHDMYNLSKERKILEDKFKTFWEGVTKKGKKSSINTLIDNYNKEMSEFSKYVDHHPPDRYQPLYLTIYTRRLEEHEATAAVTDVVKQDLASRGVSAETIRSVGDNPRVLFELISQISNKTFKDPLVGEAMPGISEQVANESYKELAHLRAQGHVAHYLPHVGPADTGEYGTYDVYINTHKVPTMDIVKSRMWDYTATTNNVMAGITHATKEILGRDGTLQVLNTFVIPKTMQRSELENAILNYKPFQDKLLDVSNPESRGSIMNRIIDHTLNKIAWNPHDLFDFKGANVIPGAESMYLDKDFARTLTKIVEHGQFPMHNLFDKVISLYKGAILQFSPRYTLHVTVGGTFMLLLRTNPFNVLRYLPNAYRMVKDGTLDDTVMHSVTQEGNEYITYHYMAGRQGAMWAIQKKLTDMGVNPKTASLLTYVKAAMNINYKLTRVAGQMQRAVAFLDGAAKVGDGMDFITDENGNRQLVTSQRAWDTGIKAVHRVMGDLRQMSPFERTYMTRLMPFYGWTKHVLSYVLSYPIDHPYRAQILANLAEANSANAVDKGMTIRSQFLLDIGTPTPTGTVSALTDRFMDPFRTVPNYAGLSGFISGLNPIATAIIAAHNPQALYGTNTLYPTKQYTDVFGIETGGTEGNTLLNMGEQFVPQLSSLAALTKMTKTYRTLAREDPTAFKKEIYEGFNIPFAQMQHLNLKQIAARHEDDKYETAKTAATQAWITGTFQAVKNYPMVPYPINTVYNITPAQLQAMYEASMEKTGLPPEDVIPYLYSPSYL